MSTSFTPTSPLHDTSTSKDVYNPSEDEKVLIESGVREFLVGKATWEDAYGQFLCKYYAKEFVEKGGMRIPILRAQGDRPSMHQFLYYGRKRVSFADRLALRYGEQARRLKDEPIEDYLRRMAPLNLAAREKAVLLQSRFTDPEWIAARNRARRARQLKAMEDGVMAFRPSVVST